MKVLLVDRGFINGPQIGRLKRDHGIDTVIPIRSDMNLQEDVRGLMKLPTTWEEYEPKHRPPLPDPTRASHGQPPHPAAKKREQTRQQTLASKQAERVQESPPDPSRIRERTLIARFPGLTSWWDCPVPLTGVYSRDLYADGHEDGWLLVTTNEEWSAPRVRDLYGVRTDIEERHRQVKCFWDLTRFHSTAFSLVVSQLVFVCLTYSLLQVHLLRQGHEELNRRTWPTSHRLLPDGDRVIIYRQQCFGFFTLLEHMELTLSLEGKARRRALRRRAVCCMKSCPTRPSPIIPRRRSPATAGLRLNWQLIMRAPCVHPSSMDRMIRAYKCLLFPGPLPVLRRPSTRFRQNSDISLDDARQLTRMGKDSTMNSDDTTRTSPTLLRRTADWGDHAAWQEFTSRYDPLIRSWCREYRLDDDLEAEVCQLFWIEVADKMRSFCYDPSRRFRGWLRDASIGGPSMRSASRVGKTSSAGRSMILRSLMARTRSLLSSRSPRKTTNRHPGGCSCWTWPSRFKAPSARGSMSNPGKCSGTSPSTAGPRARRPTP